MASSLSESDEIRRHMAQIRAELHQDVQGVVKGAEAATDWRRYVRSYPWVAVGIAFGVGYLVVPRRHKLVTPALEGVVQSIAAAAPQAAPAVERPIKKSNGLLRKAIGFATPFALRAAQGYALQFFEQYLAQKMAQGANPLNDLAARFLPEGFDPSAMFGPPGPTAPGQPTPPR